MLKADGSVSGIDTGWVDGAFHGAGESFTEAITLPLTAACARLTEPDDLAKIDGKFIWTGEYAASRLSWKRKDALWVLALRAYRLTDPITVPFRDEYGGCTSWVDLGSLPADPATTASHPALSDVAFGSKQKGVRESLPAECWVSDL